MPTKSQESTLDTTPLAATPNLDKEESRGGWLLNLAASEGKWNWDTP
jgi:hypothetical protein